MEETRVCGSGVRSDDLFINSLSFTTRWRRYHCVDMEGMKEIIKEVSIIVYINRW